MVSFQCDGCADTVKKPQLDKHRQRCWSTFSCIDCSTTFQGQDYKSHTSCISEAEKYQGALYKGPKKAGGHPGNSKSATQTPAASTPADSPAPSDSGANTIHPSRLNQMGRPEAERPMFAGGGRGGFAQRGGRGGFRGGFQKADTSRSATGENKLRPENGMRQWGSAPTSDAEVASTAPGTPVATSSTTTPGGAGEEPKKKKRKGDKGGTGAKANSRVTGEVVEEGPTKKRKREDNGSKGVDVNTTTPPSEKTVKRVKKHMKKLEEKAPASLSLSEWLTRVAEGKEKTIDQSEVLQAVRVSLVDGHWQIGA